VDCWINESVEQAAPETFFSQIHSSINPTIPFMLALALFVAGVSTDHPDDALSADDFAIFAKLFD